MGGLVSLSRERLGSDRLHGHLDASGPLNLSERLDGVPGDVQHRLPQLIGRGRALDMLLTARTVDAEEACRIGLADRLAPAGEALAMATELAHEIARFPQGAMLADRASLYAGLDLPLADALAMETRISIRSRDADAIDGAAQFASGSGRHGQF